MQRYSTFFRLISIILTVVLLMTTTTFSILAAEAAEAIGELAADLSAGQENPETAEITESERLGDLLRRLSEYDSFTDAEKKLVLSASLFTSTLSLLLTKQVAKQPLSAADTVSALRTHRLQAFLQFTRSLIRLSPSTTSPSVLTMMLPTFHSPRRKLRTPRQRALLNVSSGVSAVTVPLVLTKTLLRLSVTIPINTFRLTSSMTRRRPAVLPFLTCVSAISRLRAPIT